MFLCTIYVIIMNSLRTLCIHISYQKMCNFVHNSFVQIVKFRGRKRGWYRKESTTERAFDQKNRLFS